VTVGPGVRLGAFEITACLGEGGALARAADTTGSPSATGAGAQSNR